MSKKLLSISINRDTYIVNGKLRELPEYDDSLKGLMSAFYQGLEMNYPKFHKMDNLSKLGVIGVELLRGELGLDAYQDDEIALHFQNASASLDTDSVHQQNINEGKAASPANFVYTLPNIVLGEIAIRNKWYGENLFTLADEFDYERWMKTNEVLFAQNKAKAVAGGWVEVLEEAFELELYFIAEEK